MRHGICGLEIKLVSEQENEKRKNDALSWLKYEPVNEDTDNIEEADNNEWDVEVASAHVEVKKCKIWTELKQMICGLEIKLVSEQENGKRKNDALRKRKVGWNEEPVNEDTDNVEEADNNEWDMEVASARVEIKKIKLVSKQENKKRKNDALSKIKAGWNDEPVNEDMDNVKEANNDEWNAEVASVRVEVKKDKNMNRTQTSSARKMRP